jgi:hypothetical protein
MNAAWIAVGSPDHWQLAFDQGGIWGVIETHERQWKRLGRGDLIFAYAKAPVSGLIGIGQVTKTFKQNVPLWPPEVQSNKVIWPLRFEFDVLHLVPTARWKVEKIKLEEVSKHRLQSGFFEIPADISARILRRFPKEFRFAGQVMETPRPEYGKPMGHEEIQTILVHIGTLQRFIAEKEYPMDKERLDVVWRKVVKSVPTYVFEVQVGGDVYHALGKLKHANDLWNSRIFLVGNLKSFDDGAKRLLAGTFHEIEPILQILDVERIGRLHALKAELRRMEEELRLA